MAAKKSERLFWVGKGQVLIAGKKYRTSEEIPVALVDPDRLAVWKSDGLIADAPHGYAPKDASVAMVDGLNAQIVELGQQLKTAESKILTQDDIKKMESELTAANLKVVELTGQVSDLTAQIEALTDPTKTGKPDGTSSLTGGGAGPGAKGAGK